MTGSSDRLRLVLAQQLPHYLGRLRWLLADAVAGFSHRIVSILALNGLGLAAGAAWVGGLLAYANALESAAPITLGWLTVQPPSRDGILVPIATLTMLGATSGVLLYQAQWRTALLCVDYQISLVRRIMRVTSEPEYFGWQRIYEEPAGPMIVGLSGITTQLTSLALRRLLKGILPAATFLLAMAFLIYTNAGLTALLSPLALVYLLPLFLANRNAARLHVRFRLLSPAARGRLIMAFQGLLSRHTDARPVAEQLDSETYREAAILGYRRRLVDTVVQFINTVFTVFVLLGLFMFFILDEAPRWAELFSYLVALRFALGGLGGVTGVLVGLSRLLPEYERLSNFLERAEIIRAGNAEASAANPARIRLSGPGPGAPAVEVGAGDVVWVLAPGPLESVDREAVLASIQERARPRSCLARRYRHWQQWSAPEEGAPEALAEGDWLLCSADQVNSQRSRQLLAQFPGTVMVTDHRAARLFRKRWVALKPRVSCVIVYDGSSIESVEDTEWMAANQDTIKARLRDLRRAARESRPGGDLEMLEMES